MPIEAESVIDHYKIWLTPELQLTSDILKHVNLKDQFHQEEFKKVVDKLKWIGNPTRKDGRIADHFPLPTP